MTLLSAPTFPILSNTLPTKISHSARSQTGQWALKGNTPRQQKDPLLSLRGSAPSYFHSFGQRVRAELCSAFSHRFPRCSEGEEPPAVSTMTAGLKYWVSCRQLTWGTSWKLYGLRGNGLSSTCEVIHPSLFMTFLLSMC